MLWQRFCHSGKRGPGNETLKKRKEQTVFYDRFQPLAGPGNNENPFLFQNKTRKPAFCPAFAPPLHEKKPFDSFDVIYDLYEIKQFHWLLCVAKNCDWSTKIAPLSNLMSNLTGASLLVEWKLTAKGELNCEIYKSWRKWWKNQVSFRHRSSPVSQKVWTLPWKLRELKKYPRKTCGYGQPRGHLIRVLNERSVNDGGDFCLLWLVILKSALYSVGDTIGLWLAILSSLLCPETDRNIRIGKQGCVFYHTDFN